MVNDNRAKQLTSTPHQPASARFAWVLQANARECCRMGGLMIPEIKRLSHKNLISLCFRESALIGS
jgi:hypothetical protein